MAFERFERVVQKASNWHKNGRFEAMVHRNRPRGSVQGSALLISTIDGAEGRRFSMVEITNSEELVEFAPPALLLYYQGQHEERSDEVISLSPPQTAPKGAVFLWWR